MTAVIVLELAAAPTYAAEPGPLRVGVAKVEITPTTLKGLNPVGGPGPYGGGGDFIGVHDPLFARALLLDNGVERIALVALDSIEIFDTLPLRRRIEREVGVPADHILLMASHSHSAPRLRNGNPPYPGAQGLGTVAPVGPPSSPIPEMDANLAHASDQIVAALLQAKRSMQPARMGYASGSADLNDAHGVKTVPVFKFETLTGQPIAILFNYAVHSTVTFDTWRVSADLAGAAAGFIEQHYDNRVVALYSMGAAGDEDPKFSGDNLAKGPRPKRGDPTGRDGIASAAFPAMDAEGLMLGAEVVHVAGKMEARTTTPRIAAAEGEVTCPAKTDQPRWQEVKDGATIHYGVVLLDHTAITSVAAEVVTNIFTHLARVSPIPETVMVTAVNGHLGYLVDDASYDRKGFHPNDSSPVLRGCAESGVVDGLVGLMRSLSPTQ